jgi:hypothetical protein
MSSNDDALPRLTVARGLLLHCLRGWASQTASYRGRVIREHFRNRFVGTIGRISDGQLVRLVSVELATTPGAAAANGTPRTAEQARLNAHFRVATPTPSLTHRVQHHPKTRTVFPTIFEGLGVIYLPAPTPNSR